MKRFQKKIKYCNKITSKAAAVVTLLDIITCHGQDKLAGFVPPIVLPDVACSLMLPTSPA